MKRKKKIAKNELWKILVKDSVWKNLIRDLLKNKSSHELDYFFITYFIKFGILFLFWVVSFSFKYSL